MAATRRSPLISALPSCRRRRACRKRRHNEPSRSGERTGLASGSRRDLPRGDHAGVAGERPRPRYESPATSSSKPPWVIDLERQPGPGPWRAPRPRSPARRCRRRGSRPRPPARRSGFPSGRGAGKRTKLTLVPGGPKAGWWRIARAQLAHGRAAELRGPGQHEVGDPDEEPVAGVGASPRSRPSARAAPRPGPGARPRRGRRPAGGRRRRPRPCASRPSPPPSRDGRRAGRRSGCR